VKYLTAHFKLKFAVVNSVESRVVLPALGRSFVPAVTLIHEFASWYPRYHQVFKDACLWSGELVFSSNATLEDALSEYPYLSGLAARILPQGRCVMPSAEFTPGELEAERARLRRLMRPPDKEDAIVVLGAGFVQYRKGVDIFIDCAARVLQSPGGENCHFVWIGRGFDPEHDGAYSVYLADQLRRAGLEHHVAFVSETFAIDAAYGMADLFLLTSRLDPLPNVAIDAFAENLPVLCFDKTTGIADFLIQAGLREPCVADYLDTPGIAHKLLQMASSHELRQSVGRRSREASLEHFNMPNYVRQLEQLAQQAAVTVQREQSDTAMVAASDLFRADFARNPYETHEPREDSARAYVRAWASKIGLRKPFPGFHPGIYAEQHGLASRQADPFADYLQAGQPCGPWRYPVIGPSRVRPEELPFSERVALHVHAYFPEMLPDMIRRIALNRVAPDLFVSVPTDEVREQVAGQLRDYVGRIRDIQVVPNRGRDIGPFLHFLERIAPEDYDFVGHIHTKKSLDDRTTAMGRMWYRFLMNNLLGGKTGGAMADTVLRALQADPSVGMIFPDDPWIVGWDRNRGIAESLAAKMGLPPMADNFIFPVGTMFWARVIALEPLRRLELTWDDYPAEPLPYDGTLLHAVERLMPWGVRAAGYGIATTNIEGLSR
jgi:glycosyltransferase involved in cell wall biosynthesis